VSPSGLRSIAQVSARASQWWIACCLRWLTAYVPHGLHSPRAAVIQSPTYKTCQFLLEEVSVASSPFPISLRRRRLIRFVMHLTSLAIAATGVIQLGLVAGHAIPGSGLARRKTSLLLGEYFVIVINIEKIDKYPRRYSGIASDADHSEEERNSAFGCQPSLQ
jgi:hypothetical protein